MKVYRKVNLWLALLMAVFAGGPICLVESEAWALPFNQDMVGNQPSIGDIQRPEPGNSIPLGSLTRDLQMTREEATNLENPVSASVSSVAHGERLFSANCSPCHGRVVGPGEVVLGGVQGQVPGPALFVEPMWEKPDGHYFTYIHYGGLAIMPAYGWRLTHQEEWDIVNYIRKVQNEVREKQGN